jgi:hypothetical protein
MNGEKSKMVELKEWVGENQLLAGLLTFVVFLFIGYGAMYAMMKGAEGMKHQPGQADMLYGVIPLSAEMPANRTV